VIGGFFLVSLLQISVVLAVFNLIPVPPLDGSKILMALLPPRTAISFNQTTARFGPFILLLLVLPILSRPAPIEAVITPLVNGLMRWLLP
jgi:Zn-dependent protease